MEDFSFLHQNFEEEEAANTSGPKEFENLELPDIYLVEDDQVLGPAIKRYLEKGLNFKVKYFTHPSKCLEDITSQSNLKDNKEFPHLLITDITFEGPNVDGLLLIDLLKERGHRLPSIVMTGFASIETAINATKKGVYHYLTKPFELSVLADLVVQLVSSKLGIPESKIRAKEVSKNLTNSSRTLGPTQILESINQDDIFCSMIGRSKAMKELFERIKKVSESDSTILINGPSGTGKELVANAIHTLSTRNKGPLISVNCGAIPGDLLESELFGHVKGAFTGALSDRKGRFEQANLGSLFLDEIGDMPLILQVKILRVLQNKVVEKVGGAESIPINTRIITATHRDLEKAVHEGNFREDLYYRLNVIPLRVPALAERREDIPLLISHFTSKFASADGRNSIRFADETIEILKNYSWPGNVRELENLIERLVILRGGHEIKPDDLPLKIKDPPHSKPGFSISNMYDLIKLPDDGLDLKNFLSKIEEGLIKQALDRCQNNKNQASRLLRMNRTTLIEKIKKSDFSSTEIDQRIE